MTKLGLAGVPRPSSVEEVSTPTASFSEETQKFAPSNLVTLFELDLTDLGGELLKFTSSSWEGAPVVWQGNTYSPVPIEADGFEVSSSGTLPAPQIRVLNTPTLQSGVIAMDDLVGATLRRIRTFKTFLDEGDSPDPNAHFPIDVFKVDRKMAHNKVFIEWELAASIDQEGRMIPGRQILRNFCTHVYRRFDEDTGEFDYSIATCPYVEELSYDRNDQPVDPEDDVCGKRLSSCKARFGDNTSLPIRAFPGAARVR